MQAKSKMAAKVSLPANALSNRVLFTFEVP